MRQPIANPQSAILFTKISVALVCSWPPSNVDERKRRTVFEAFQFLAFLNVVLLFLPQLYGIYVYRNDFTTVATCIPLLGAVTQALFKIAVCYVLREQFRDLVDDLETFCKNATGRDREILQDYVNNHMVIHVAYTLCSYFTSIAVITGPLYLPQRFPTLAVYPFSVEESPISSIVYIQQALVGFQASASLCADCQIALLLRYITARFQMLIADLQQVVSTRHLRDCVEQHKQLLRYADRLNHAVRLLVLSTATTTSIAFIFGTVILVTDQPIMLKVTFCVVVFTASAELLVCASPADSLMYMSSQVSWGIYSSRWFEQDLQTQRDIVHVIMRSTKPQTIGIKGILPCISLQYYASFLYTSFTYYTALKVVLDKGKI